ncbi:MAG TPA: hypothetical protein VKI17_01080 [Gemmataceae bacterium]|nr:hypothetical protein [Gemmataceae bacterium]
MACWLLGIALVAGLPVPPVKLAAATAVVAKPVWHTDYASARKIAQRAGKPLLVVFRCEH